MLKPALEGAPADEFSGVRQRDIVGGTSQAAYLLAAPAFCLALALFIVPILAVVLIALTDWQFGATSFSFVGLKNFAELAQDPVFRRSAANTAVYAGIVVPLTVGLGLGVALAIESGRSLRSFYRAVHFLPYMSTLAAMAVVWESMLHPTLGLVNQLLSAAGLPTTNWLRNEVTALPALAAIGVWQNLGFAMVLFMAGLKAIPEELYEAAAIDGAHLVLDRLRTVTLPMLGPIALFVALVTTMRALQTFDTVTVLTQGGPAHASEVVLYTLYVESFEYLRTGYGASMTVIVLTAVAAITAMQNRLAGRRVHYS